MNNRSIVFLLSHIPNPRANKRISVLKECYDVSVICSRRKSQDIWEPSHLDVQHIIMDIDLPSSKHLLKRWFVSKTYKRQALKHLESLKPDVIYSEGLDSLTIANIYQSTHPGVRIFYEVADLRESFIGKPRSPLKKLTVAMISMMEKKNFRTVDFLVLTSMKFYEAHYNKLIDRDKVLFLPNMPDLRVFSTYQRKKIGKFTVGFIGGIRYLNQMKMLVDAAEQAGCDVLFAGAGATMSDYEQITAYCKDKPFVRFTGRYDYNKDIATLYGMVDCVYAVYDADNPNVRIALPNKLYEAVLCELPIIVAKGTYLSELVEEWGVGVAVSHTKQEDLEETLYRLANDKPYYQRFADGCRKHKEDMDNNNDSKELVRRLKLLIQ